MSLPSGWETGLGSWLLVGVAVWGRETIDGALSVSVFMSVHLELIRHVLKM